MLDWVTRTLLLILSGLATFAIIASLASTSRLAPSGSGQAAPYSTPAPPQADLDDAPEEIRPAASPEADAPRQIAEHGASGQSTGGVRPKASAASGQTLPPSPSQNEIARWLEALTYAVLALAGFAAAILVVMVRISAQLARVGRT